MPGVQMENGQQLQLSARISPDSDVRNAAHAADSLDVTVGEIEGRVTLVIDRKL